MGHASDPITSVVCTMSMSPLVVCISSLGISPFKNNPSFSYPFDQMTKKQLDWVKNVVLGFKHQSPFCATGAAERGGSSAPASVASKIPKDRHDEGFQQASRCDSAPTSQDPRGAGEKKGSNQSPARPLKRPCQGHRQSDLLPVGVTDCSHPSLKQGRPHHGYTLRVCKDSIIEVSIRSIVSARSSAMLPFRAGGQGKGGVTCLGVANRVAGEAAPFAQTGEDVYLKIESVLEAMCRCIFNSKIHTDMYRRLSLCNILIQKVSSAVHVPKDTMAKVGEILQRLELESKPVLHNKGASSDSDGSGNS